jgi:hypothetical protein
VKGKEEGERDDEWGGGEREEDRQVEIEGGRVDLVAAIKGHTRTTAPS